MKSNWTEDDKRHAWHEYLIGAELEQISLFIGGTRDDVLNWIKGVCKGQERCIYNWQFSSSREPWTKRQDRMLWLMYQSRIRFHDAARLLARFPIDVRMRLIHLKNEKP